MHSAFALSRNTNQAHRRRGGLGLALLAALVLSGCSMFGDNKSKLDLACPKVGIVRDASKITIFRPGSAKGPADVVARGLVADFNGNCTYDKTGVTIDVTLALVAERGPAMVGNELPLSYFVAVQAPDASIVTKQEFATTIDFPTNGPRAGSREELQPRIPLLEAQDARGYQLLVGFQLQPDQVEYNRKPGVK